MFAGLLSAYRRGEREMPERREVRSWRSRPEEVPLSASGDGSETNSRQQTQQTQQTYLTRREIESETCTANRQQTDSKPPADPPCWVAGCPEEATDRHLIYCAPHRVMADDGTLLLRCVFSNGHAPVAPFDPIACAAHRIEIDRETALMDQEIAEQRASLEAAA